MVVGRKEKQVLHPKSQGHGFMLRDFIEEHGWYLWQSPEEHELVCSLCLTFQPEHMWYSNLEMAIGTVEAS